MPNILLFRILKNIVVSIGMLSAGIIFGSSLRSIYIACIPLLFCIIAAGASIKMYFDWKTGKVYVITAVCIHKQPKLFGKSTYIFKTIENLSDKEFTFTLSDITNNSFSIAATYDFLFNNKKNTISTQNLIDYSEADIVNGQLEEILSQIAKEDRDDKTIS